MNYHVCDYTLPENFVLPTSTEVLILPWCSAKESEKYNSPIYPESTSTILKLLQKKSIAAKLAEGQLDSVTLEDRHSMEWFGPTILFTSAAITDNPHIVSITLNVISSYLTNIFFGDRVSKDEPNADISIIIQNRNGIKKIKYKGPVSGISAFGNIVKDNNSE